MESRRQATARPRDVDGRALLGARAETLALRWLRRRGLELVARNFRCRYGEIDLLMQDGEMLVVVEVRCRAGASPHVGRGNGRCPEATAAHADGARLRRHSPYLRAVAAPLRRRRHRRCPWPAFAPGMDSGRVSARLGPRGHRASRQAAATLAPRNRSRTPEPNNGYARARPRPLRREYRNQAGRG